VVYTKELAKKNGVLKFVVIRLTYLPSPAAGGTCACRELIAAL
jgi:hypothetical protein